MSFVSDAANRNCPNPLDSFNFDIVDGIDQIEVEQERLHKQIIAQIDKDLRAYEKKLNGLGAKVTAVAAQTVSGAESALNGMYNNIHNTLSGEIETASSALCHLPCPTVSFVGGSFVCYSPDNVLLGPAFSNPDGTWSYVPKDWPECFGNDGSTNNSLVTTPAPTTPLPNASIDARVLSCFPDSYYISTLPTGVYGWGNNFVRVDDATGCCLISATPNGPWAIYSCPVPGSTTTPIITTPSMPNVTIIPTPTTPLSTTPYPTPKTPEECCIQLVQLVKLMSTQQDNQNTLISVLTKAIGELKGQPDITVNCGDGTQLSPTTTTPKPSTSPKPTTTPNPNPPATEQCDDALERIISEPFCEIDTYGKLMESLVKSKTMYKVDPTILTASFAYEPSDMTKAETGFWSKGESDV
jgi:hypothetical protein